LPAKPKTVKKTVAWGDIIFVLCESCGCWCQSPQITAETLAQWYDSDQYQGSAKQRGTAYINYLQDEDQRLKEAQQRYRNDLAAYLPLRGGRILEIGCATGSLLTVVRDAGHEVFGIDLSQRFAETARQLHGLDVQVADILCANVADGYFDMILLFGTLSNLSDISGAVARIHRLLKPTGMLVANFPRADSAVARLYGANFWMFAPSVNTILTRKGCAIALDRGGFSILKSGVDFQAPGLHKLLNHAKFGALLPALDALGLGAHAMPFRIPVPGVHIVWACRA
jgi:SAM-dependent methyltransferase